MERKAIEPENLWSTQNFGFVHAVETNEAKRRIYISGQSGIRKDGSVMEEGFQAQCKKAFESIDEVLKKAGGTFHNVVKLNGYFIQMNMENLLAYTKIVQSYCKGELPAQTVVEVRGLALPGMLLEVEAIAEL
jgi:enamine deaminase RidA (YjgF/YER057c/UK114 family)